MNGKINLDEIKIASPCRARWEDMDGNDRARFCGQCQKHVYNFSAMPRREVENLIREKEGRLCGRFYQRTDGRMLTADCPSESRQRRNWFKRMGGAAMAFVLFLAAGCARQTTTGKNAPKTTPLGNSQIRPEPLMGKPVFTGKVCVPQTTVTNISTPPK